MAESTLKIPKLSLVVLVGASGSGKSTFAQKHFLKTEVLSSDRCRGLVSDDENNQAATSDAFDVLHYIAAKRLAAGRLTVIDATNVQPESRKSLIRLAKQYHVLAVAIVLNLSEKICVSRNESRPDRDFGARVVRHQRSQLRRSLRTIRKEGFRYVHVLDSDEKIDEAIIERAPLWNDRRDESGPFDIIGDIHGCGDELQDLLTKLGYEEYRLDDPGPGWSPISYCHPEGRKAFFVGDLVDRGPRSVDVVSIVHNMMKTDAAMCVPGNHDVKLVRKLRGRGVQVKHGLAQTLEDIERVHPGVRPQFQKQLAEFLDSLVSHFVLDDGKLVIAHAGLKEEFHGRASGHVREFALYGDTTGERDEYGLPVRRDWAAEYRGEAIVVYGHTPVASAQWLNKTINIDTGCVFGGQLTALRYPELETVSVDARETYCESPRPFLNIDDGRSKQHRSEDILDASDVIGKKIVSTRLRPNITIREENATAALEVVSRFAVDPKWLIYLPPTMSPPETSKLEGFLEHPAEAFHYYRENGIQNVVCQEKHMGSRAVVTVCKNSDAARDQFGVMDDTQGIVVTRTGRKFFSDNGSEEEFISRLASALTSSDFWRRFNTEWVCLDCELMPWSAKAQELLKRQYAAVGAAARASLPSSIESLRKTADLLPEVDSDLLRVLRSLENSQSNVEKFTRSYRNYCWPVNSINDLKLAPFHILATEKSVHVDKTHRWHMDEIAQLCAADEDILLATRNIEVDLNDESSIATATKWWQEMTSSGGEGMVVKPMDFVIQNENRIVQPAIKCRGKEYLRIIYGPDYDSERNLNRLRNRHLGRKRSLAEREFALGVESLERFVRSEPLRNVHQCVFGVLALESEPVDPRL